MSDKPFSRTAERPEPTPNRITVSGDYYKSAQPFIASVATRPCTGEAIIDASVLNDTFKVALDMAHKTIDAELPEQFIQHFLFTDKAGRLVYAGPEVSLAEEYIKARLYVVNVVDGKVELSVHPDVEAEKNDALIPQEREFIVEPQVGSEFIAGLHFWSTRETVDMTNERHPDHPDVPDTATRLLTECLKALPFEVGFSRRQKADLKLGWLARRSAQK